MRADSAVEPTRSENITVTWRRSARSSGGALGALDVVAASTEGVLPCASARSAAMASSRIRRSPSAVTPSSLRSSAVRLGRTRSFILLSRNAASYSSRPRLRSQTTTSMTAPLLRVAAHHRLSNAACPAQHPKQPSLLRELIHAEKATRSPLNLAPCRRSLGAPLTPLQPALRVGLCCQRGRPTNQDAARIEPRKSDMLIRTVFRNATAPFS